MRNCLAFGIWKLKQEITLFFQNLTETMRKIIPVAIAKVFFQSKTFHIGFKPIRLRNNVIRTRWLWEEKCIYK